MGLQWTGPIRSKSPESKPVTQAPVADTIVDAPATSDMFIETPVNIAESVERVAEKAGELVVYTQFLPSNDSDNPNIRYAEQIRARRMINND